MVFDSPHIQALKICRNVVFEFVHEKGQDLSLRQLAILLTIYLEPPPHTVRGLAHKLNVTKPVVTRALDALGKIGLLERRRDEKDRRNVIIQRTVLGALTVERIGDTLVRQLKI